MPCCGLSEYRVKVPLKYTLTGVLVFWSTFIGTLLVGLLLVLSSLGRQILKCQGAFIQALWYETMRQPESIPARWACRLSGYLFQVSPTLAEIIYRRPEIPVFMVLSLLVSIVIGGGYLCLSWVNLLTLRNYDA